MASKARPEATETAQNRPAGVSPAEAAAEAVAAHQLTGGMYCECACGYSSATSRERTFRDQYADHVAEAVLASLSGLGWQLRRQISTDEDLDALRPGSVIFDADHDVIAKDDFGLWCFWGDFPGPDDEEATVTLPALVVYEAKEQP